jgi:outer membrane protein, multidrug efflux system
MTSSATSGAARTNRPSRPKCWRCRLLAGVAAVAFTGCTLGPDYKRPQLPLTTDWRAGLPDAAELANTDWWKAFGDPDLDRLIDAAIDANRDLLLATYRIEEYDARLQVSRAPNYPQVGYAAGVSRELRSQERPNGLPRGADPFVNNVEVGANASWELDLWGKVRRSNEAALAELLSTQEARRGVMLSVVASVATSYVQLLELDLRLAYAQQGLQNRQKALDLLDSKYRGGSTTRLAVEQARAELEADAAEIPPIEREIAMIENALSGLLARNAGPIRRHTLQALAMPQMPQGVPADLLTRRPDVMAAEQDLIAANARIGLAQTEYFPTLSLMAALGLGADDPKWLWATTARTGNIAAALVGPIFSGGRIEGDIRQAEAVQKQKVVLYQQTVQNALKEVEDALVSRAKAGDREAALGRQVVSLEEVAKLARLRYEGGQSTLMEVLDADLKLYFAQGSQARSRRDTLLGLVSVYKSMGGGWMVEQERRRAPAMPSAGVQAQAVIEAGTLK